VGEGGDEVSVARFIADQRTLYRVPVAFTCALLGVSVSWFYKWRSRQPTKSARRRAKVDAAVATEFTARRGPARVAPAVRRPAREGLDGEEKTVADSMRRQGLVARKIKRRNGLTRQDKTKAKFPDLLRRDFTATAVNTRWVGDITEIPTAAGKLYLATVIDLYSRRLLGAATPGTPTPTWRVPRSRWRSRSAAASTPSTGSSFTPIGARPTRRTRSQNCAATAGSGSRWAASGRVSTVGSCLRLTPTFWVSLLLICRPPEGRTTCKWCWPGGRDLIGA
jgi:putative transposase